MNRGSDWLINRDSLRDRPVVHPYLAQFRNINDSIQNTEWDSVRKFSDSQILAKGGSIFGSSFDY